MSQGIVILDFGSQVTQLIARRVREAGVYCEIFPFNAPLARIREFNPRGIILSGGPASVHLEGTPQVDSAIFTLNLPVLGICYGQQAMAHDLGGKVESDDHREFGRAFINVTAECELFNGLWEKGQRHQVWMSHGDRVTALPHGFQSGRRHGIGTLCSNSRR